MQQKLSQTAGVLDLSFDKQTLEITVHHDASIAPETLTELCSGCGEFKCVVGEKRGFWATQPVFAKELDVAWITKKGEAFDLPSVLVSGKVTVVDFYADWCGPCRKVDEFMAEYMGKNPGEFAFRKANIVDWDTPVAKQHLKNIAGLPYAMIYDRAGRLLWRLTQFNPDELFAVLEKMRVQK